MTRTASAPELKAAAGATFLVFGINGLVFASWAARIPAVTEILHITSGQMGTLLLCVAVGSLIALPTAGFVVGRLGTANTVRAAGLLAAVAGAGVALSLAAQPFPERPSRSSSSASASASGTSPRTLKGPTSNTAWGAPSCRSSTRPSAAAPSWVRWLVLDCPASASGSGAPAGHCRRRRGPDHAGPAVLPPARPGAAPGCRRSREATGRFGLAGRPHPADRRRRPGRHVDRGCRQRLDRQGRRGRPGRPTVHRGPALRGFCAGDDRHALFRRPRD